MPVSYELQTLTSGMSAIANQQDIVAQNLANVNTVGYKRDIAVDRSFPTMLSSALDAQQAPEKNLYDEVYFTNRGEDFSVLTHETVTIHEQGDMRVTENPFDLALVSDGFFTIKTPEGIRYTRNGSFTLNAQNQLVTPRGDLVLGKGGTITGEGVPIVIDGTQVAFLKDGTVNVDTVPVSSLKIVDMEDYTQLKKEGDSYFHYYGNQGDVTDATNATVEQGYLEGSNVNAITETTNMMAQTRYFEMSGKAFKAVEQTINRAIVELSKGKAS